MKINAHLDNLQEAFIRELYEAEFKESQMIGQLLDSIEKNENEIRKYQENLISIKQHASDLQTFLVIKQLERDVADKEEYFTSLVESNKFNRVSLSCKMNYALQNSFNKIRQFGELKVSTILWERETQAQTVLAHARFMSIENLSIVLQSTVDTKLKDIRGCTMLPDGRMVFTCRNENFVRGFNSNGSKDFDLKLRGAFDITYIHDNNSIAITSVDERCISIINVESRKIRQTIPMQSCCYGIVIRETTLIYCAYYDGLRMINLTDKSVKDIVTSKISYYANIAAFGDKLYYPNRDTHTVTCCELRGTTQWTFNDESGLKEPYAISVDNAGNVYVAGYKSNNVVLISPDKQ